MWTPPLPEHRNSGRDEVEDLLGKGHDQAARQGEKALERWEGSWLWKERPTCTTPQPNKIRPMARIREKMKVERLFTTVSGSLAAKTVVDRQPTHSTVAA